MPYWWYYRRYGYYGYYGDYGARENERQQNANQDRQNEREHKQVLNQQKIDAERLRDAQSNKEREDRIRREDNERQDKREEREERSRIQQEHQRREIEAEKQREADRKHELEVKKLNAKTNKEKIKKEEERIAEMKKEQMSSKRADAKRDIEVAEENMARDRESNREELAEIKKEQEEELKKRNDELKEMEAELSRLKKDSQTLSSKKNDMIKKENADHQKRLFELDKQNKADRANMHLMSEAEKKEMQEEFERKKHQSEIEHKESLEQIRFDFERQMEENSKNLTLVKNFQEEAHAERLAQLKIQKEEDRLAGLEHKKETAKIGNETHLAVMKNTEKRMKHSEKEKNATIAVLDNQLTVLRITDQQKNSGNQIEFLQGSLANYLKHEVECVNQLVESANNALGADDDEYDFGVPQEYLKDLKMNGPQIKAACLEVRQKNNNFTSIDPKLKKKTTMVVNEIEMKRSNSERVQFQLNTALRTGDIDKITASIEKLETYSDEMSALSQEVNDIVMTKDRVVEAIGAASSSKNGDAIEGSTSDKKKKIKYRQED